MEDDIICRCAEVCRVEIREAIRAGARTSNEVKRFTNAGMGLCQGRTCRKLIEQVIAAETGTTVDEVQPASYRMPTRPVSIESIVGKMEEKTEASS